MAEPTSDDGPTDDVGPDDAAPAPTDETPATDPAPVVSEVDDAELPLEPEADAVTPDESDEPEDGKATSPVELPQRFNVGFRLGRFDGGATLVVGAGELTLHPDSSLQAQGGFHVLTHDHTTVRVYAARWQPPTSNTGLLLEDGEQVALVDLPGWSRERLRTSLAAAGFERDETLTSLRLGRDLVRPTKRWWD